MYKIHVNNIIFW